MPWLGCGNFGVAQPRTDGARSFGAGRPGSRSAPRQRHCPAETGPPEGAWCGQEPNVVVRSGREGCLGRLRPVRPSRLWSEGTRRVAAHQMPPSGPHWAVTRWRIGRLVETRYLADTGLIWKVRWRVHKPGPQGLPQVRPMIGFGRRAGASQQSRPDGLRPPLKRQRHRRLHDRLFEGRLQVRSESAFTSVRGSPEVNARWHGGVLGGFLQPGFESGLRPHWGRTRRTSRSGPGRAWGRRLERRFQVGSRAGLGRRGVCRRYGETVGSFSIQKRHGTSLALVTPVRGPVR